MKYAYHNTGLMPAARAADARALGSLGGTVLDHPTLPVPGAPEVMAGTDCGCGCKGHGGCGGGAMSGIADIPNMIGVTVRGAMAGDPTSIALTAGGAYVLYRLFFKKRR